MRRQTLRLSVMIIVGAASAAPACSPRPDADALSVDEKSSALWLGSSATLWPAGQINVCFQGFSSTERASIRSAVEDGWQRAANLDFFGWGTCPTIDGSTSNIVVVSADAPSPLAGQATFCTDQNAATCTGNVGRAPLGDYNRVRFAGTTPPRRVVLHEFGHVLGFVHETLDSDMGVPCHQITSGGISEENEGDAANSIMVAFVSCNAATTLSNWDVLGVRRVYGLKPQNSVVGLGGRCLNIQAASTAFGASIIGWPCTGGQNDTFQRNDGDLLLKTHLGNDITGVDRCLNISGGVVSPTSGTNMISWQCATSASNEQFHFGSVQWLAMGKMCVAASNAAAGATLAIANCSGATLQQWDFFESDKRIRLSGTNLCVNISGGNTALGTRATLATCGATPGPNETFIFGRSEIRFADKCLNVLGGSTTVGNQIGLWDGCDVVPSPANEQFTTSGAIHGMGQCVDMFGGVSFDGVQIGVFPCQAGAPNEVWERFW